MIKVKIKERSFLAKLAARKLKWNSAAIVFGNTIHLWNLEKHEILQNRRLLLHELEHVRQYNKYGIVGFTMLYLLESVRSGYYKNRFEAEAREAENKFNSMDEYIII